MQINDNIDTRKGICESHLFSFLDSDIIDKYVEKVEQECYNSSEGLKLYTKENQHRNYIQEILQSMTSSEIMQMILDKRKEIKLYPEAKEWYSDSSQIDLINLLINRLNFELRQRDPETKTENTKEYLDQKKREVSIVDVIQSVAGVQFPSGLKRHIRCPLPNHEEKSASFYVYEHSNKFYCFGCHKNGSQVDFIREYRQCSIGEAIKIFLQF